MEKQIKPIPPAFKTKLHRLNERVRALMEIGQTAMAQAQQSEKEAADIVLLCREQMGLTEDWELTNIEHGFVPKEEKAEE